MEPITSVLLALTGSLVFAAWHARRIGNERRDVALLTGVASVLGLGAGVSAVV